MYAHTAWTDTNRHIDVNIKEITFEGTYCELNLAASHDVIQEGIHFNNLSGKKEPIILLITSLLILFIYFSSHFSIGFTHFYLFIYLFSIFPTHFPVISFVCLFVFIYIELEASY